ncbi:hypothetical protein [Subtercola vilae]|uniref:DUF4386 domain-containing protein n=1 Tax=Subtercola vilae TaxID=2056433 RepID=A0A4T2C8V1_9MICO|nr:hypothetical protein [Subtercola vilae]TIH40072.1 hypothetical protein D4765_02790 [Subtercola vilae]
MPRILTQHTLKPDVRRWTGISAIAVAVLMSSEFVVKVAAVGSRPELSDESALAAFTAKVANASLTVIFIDIFLMAALVVFLASLRQLITVARHDLQWVADLSYGSGLVFVAVTLVGDALDAGGALDTVGQAPNGTVIRALIEGHIVMFGSIGGMLTALVVAAAGYVTFASTTLPRWTGWFAFAVAATNLLSVPAIFNGTSSKNLFSAGGPGVTATATFPFLAWVIVVGVVTIRGERHHRERLAERVGHRTAESPVTRPSAV